jgi:putative spermidine/putrescine transport system substrate-binding protein
VPRRALLLLMTALTLTVTACGGSDDDSSGDGSAETRDYQGVTLKVANCCGAWNEATAAAVDRRFAKMTGAKVAYTEAYAQQLAPQVIEAGGQDPPYDVVFTDDQVQTQLAEMGLIEKADSETLTQAAEVEVPALNDGYPPGVWLFYVGVVYNEEKFKEQGIPAPKTWADLWHPKLAGRISIPALSTPQGFATVVAAAAAAGADPYDVEAGVKKLAELDLYSVYSSSSQYQTDLSNGNIWVAVGTDGRAFQLIDDKQPLAFVAPEVPGIGKKGFVSRSMVDVVKGTEQPELAKIYQQLASDAVTEVAVAEAAGYSPILQEAIDEVVADDPKWKERWPSPAEASEYYAVDWSKGLPVLGEATDLFAREVGGG